jgi:hypothetical protein
MSLAGAALIVLGLTILLPPLTSWWGRRRRVSALLPAAPRPLVAAVCAEPDFPVGAPMPERPSTPGDMHWGELPPLGIDDERALGADIRALEYPGVRTDSTKAAAPYLLESS